MDIGNNIKKIRSLRGLTQKQLSEILQVNINTIQNYESGRRTPNIETLTKIADALDVDLWDIIEKHNNFEIDVNKNKNTSPKIDKIISRIEKETAVKEWILNTDISIILTRLLEENPYFNELKNDLEILSILYEIEFCKTNNLQGYKISVESRNAKIEYKSQYLKTIIDKILITTDFEHKLINLSAKLKEKELTEFLDKYNLLRILKDE